MGARGVRLCSAAWEAIQWSRLRFAVSASEGVEFDADDFAEGEFAGDEHGSAFACADVERKVYFSMGVGWCGGLARGR